MTTRNLFFLLWIAGGVLPACQREPHGDKGESRDTSDTAHVDTAESGDTGESGDTEDSTETGHIDTDDSDDYMVDINDVARLTVYGDERMDLLGNPFVLGDVSGDGADDFCFISDLTTPPQCVGFRSPVPEGVFAASEADFSVVLYDSRYFSAPGDVNGDGVDDLAIWNLVVLGPVEDRESYKAADITLLYDDYYYPNPVQVNQGDTNGDGIDDFILELRHIDEKTSLGTYDKILYSGLDSPVIESDAYLTFIRDPIGVGEYGFMGDTNGDGYDDLGYSRGSLALGPLPSLIPHPDISPPEIEFLSSLSLRAAGDVNGDGYDDVASHGYVLGDVAEGVQVYLAPFEGEVPSDHAVAGMFMKEGEIEDGVDSISSVGDQNGDSLPDMAFITVDISEGILHTVFLWETPFEGLHTTDDATLALESSDSPLRSALLDGHGDFTGDGSSNDFLVGDAYNSAFASQGGVGWVMIGGTLY